MRCDDCGKERKNPAFSWCEACASYRSEMKEKERLRREETSKAIEEMKSKEYQNAMDKLDKRIKNMVSCDHGFRESADAYVSKAVKRYGMVKVLSELIDYINFVNYDKKEYLIDLTNDILTALNRYKGRYSGNV